MNQQPTRSPPVFYCPTLAAKQATAEIVGDEANHGIRSRRLRIGDPVSLTNGRGLMTDGRVTSIDAKAGVFVAALDAGVLTVPARRRFVLASALPKGDRQSTMLDMATQLGMDCFIPLDCEHSAVRYQEKMTDRWRRVVESACKQSRRSWFPVIDGPGSPLTVLENFRQDTVVLYGDHRAINRCEGSHLIQDTTRTIALMAGPEGGFSPQEIAMLEAASFAHGVAIGGHVLRTETAAVALLAHATSYV